MRQSWQRHGDVQAGAHVSAVLDHSHHSGSTDDSVGGGLQCCRGGWFVGGGSVARGEHDLEQAWLELVDLRAWVAQTGESDNSVAEDQIA